MANAVAVPISAPAPRESNVPAPETPPLTPGLVYAHVVSDRQSQTEREADGRFGTW